MSCRVVHSGIRYIDKEQPQAPTTIVKGTVWNGSIVPADRIHYISGKDSGWTIDLLLRSTGTIFQSGWLEIYKQRYIGKTIKVLLPIQIEGVTNEYTFSFLIEDFVEIQ